MVFRKLYLVLPAASLSVAGCGSDVVSGVCLSYRGAGISVDVRDSITNALVGQGSIITASDGIVADTSEYTPFGPGPYPLAYEMPGSFTVTVTQNGYQPWTKTGVLVTSTSDGCHVNVVSLTARVQK